MTIPVAFSGNGGGGGCFTGDTSAAGVGPSGDTRGLRTSAMHLYSQPVRNYEQAYI